MELDKVFIYRITHVENMSHICQFGITHQNSKNKSPNYVSIGDSSLINTRNEKGIEINGKCLGDYIPFYFGYRSPMLYVIQKGYNGVEIQNGSNIIYCVSSIQKVLDSKIPFLYTDGHATNNFTKFYEPKDIANITEQLDFEAINATFWRKENDLDFKRRKEAEFLLENDLPLDCILGYAVLNDIAKNKLIGIGIDSNKVGIRKKYYYD